MEFRAEWGPPDRTPLTPNTAEIVWTCMALAQHGFSCLRSPSFGLQAGELLQQKHFQIVGSLEDAFPTTIDV